MKTMAIEVVNRRPSTSKPAPGHKISPYLLRKLPIAKPNQVWATDIRMDGRGAWRDNVVVERPWQRELGATCGASLRPGYTRLP
ncbi:hypothetical protein [Novosphingobium clariflavum]|uniref:hypothetical protein n=1 Tax=uncultured Novosphingobium sp. TaxID=292277 RepID=UPI002264A442|nr:hypothetical protein [Novosphingobium clariflavum]